jgi:hypothetical protein
MYTESGDCAKHPSEIIKKQEIKQLFMGMEIIYVINGNTMLA